MEKNLMVTLASQHVSQATQDLLDRECNEDNMGLCVYPKDEYGWFIYAKAGSQHNVPEDLKEVMDYADCDVLCLDHDCPADPNLAVYVQD